jgi:hypothetical protein
LCCNRLGFRGLAGIGAPTVAACLGVRVPGRALRQLHQ